MEKRLAPVFGNDKKQGAPMTKKLRHGSLFTGVGGVDLGLEWAGFETAWQVEIDPFARRVLEKRWSDVPKFTDVRECGKHNLEPVNIISGGFPCVGISVAGKRRGLGTAGSPTQRSGLWFEYRRIIGELRPRWVLIENVSRLLETADAGTVLDGLEETGYSWWSRLIDAGALGAPHKRERTFILCHDDACGSCVFCLYNSNRAVRVVRRMVFNQRPQGCSRLQVLIAKYDAECSVDKWFD
jgi:DNA-cytosine methyltransferase